MSHPSESGSGGPSTRREAPGPTVNDEATVQISATADSGGGASQPSFGRDKPVGARLFADGAAAPGLGRFIVLRRLGAGAMGTVFAAYDPQLDRTLALKLLHSGSGSASSRAALLREAQSLARLAHPNVVAVHEVGTIDDEVFVAMEYVQGATLREWLSARPRGWREILPIFRQACQGLDAAHRAGLVHRDFKPANVLVGDDGRVRVADFGLARATSSDPGERAAGESKDAEDAQRTTLAGTPAYMSPEALLGQRCGTAGDQFSFCVALYEALHGERPFRGPTHEKYLKAILDGPPRGRGAVPTWLRRAVNRGLAADPNGRWPTMTALGDALSGALAARRDRVALAATVVVAPLLAAYAYVGTHAPEPPCQGARAHTQAIWGDARRAEVEGALRATELPYAGDMWAGTRDRIDRYADAWVAAHAEACEATHLHHEQSEALLDLRMTCLKEHLNDLAAVVDVLAAADAKVTERAVDAVADLPPIAACGDTEALLAQVRPPDDPAIRAAVDAQRIQLGHARASMAFGKYQESGALAEAVVAAAEGLAYRPLLAEALLLQGKIAYRTGDPEAGARMMAEAFWAAQASRVDEVAAASAAELTFIRGVVLDKPEIGELWARTSEATLGRMGERRDVGYILLTSRGNLANHVGDLARAVAYHEEAVALIEAGAADPSTPDPHLATALANLGISLAAIGDYERAVDSHRRSLEIDIAAFGVDHPHHASSYNNLGIALDRRGRFAEAQESFERALVLYERSLGPTHPRLATPLTNLGSLLKRQGKNAEAAAVQRRALAILEKTLPPGHHVVATVQLNLGGTLIELSGPDEPAFGEGESLLRRAEAAFIATFGEDGTMLAYPLASLGRAAMLRGDEDEAVRLLERASTLFASGSGAPAEIAEVNFFLAQTLSARSPGRALELAESAARDYASAGVGFTRERAEVEAWIAAR